MKPNRKKVYLGLSLFLITGVCTRLIVFPEREWTWHVAVLVTSIAVLLFIFEGFLAIHLALERWLPLHKKTFVRTVVQLIIGILIVVPLRYTLLKVFGSYLPFKVSPELSLILIAFDVFVAVGINLAYIGWGWFEQWKASVLMQERMAREKASVQYDNLKNQLNPHFLFNALTSLHSLIFENQQLAASFLQQLSKVYRYVLRHKDKDMVSLQTELDFLSHYMQLLQTRFGDGLRISLTITPLAYERMIVPVTLQIVLENALKHNIASEDQPLHIEIFNEDYYLTVKNNLQKRSVAEHSNGQGLANLQAFYAYLSPLPVKVEITPTHFLVHIPLIE